MTEKHAPNPDAEFVPDDAEPTDGPSARRQDQQFESGRMVGATDGAGLQLDERVLGNLATIMTAGGGGPSDVPAGYTYLGQFIAHDLSFERVTVAPGQRRAGPVPQQRSPMLDLDSLYGSGFESGQVAWQADGVKLSLDAAVAVPGRPGRPDLDLPRLDGAATVPDARNDENLAVAQTHVAFIRFHNEVVDMLSPPFTGEALFDEARALVTKHYQWIVWHDYLPRVCDETTIADVTAHGRKVFETGATTGDGSVPKLPIEFSVAAFRFGHSMLRTNYNWNEALDDGAGTLDRLFALSANGGDLAPNIPITAVADFRRLYDFAADGHAGLGGANDAGFNFAMRIDTALNARVRRLPAATFTRPGEAPPQDPRMANIAFRDMGRAKGRNLATGQDMVKFLNEHGAGITPLTDAQLRDGAGGADLKRLRPQDVDAIVENTPLWFYVLREAEVHGGKLHGAGARIVVEVVHRAIQASAKASICKPNPDGSRWQPTLGAAGKPFRMTDLLRVAFGDAHLKDPLGA
jgi:hypothetical protein